jgi:hypothetical protein
MDAFAAPEKAPVLFIGYSKARLADFADPRYAARLMAGTDLKTSDSALAMQARVRIVGLVRPESARNVPGTFAVDVLYRQQGRVKDVPYLAWTYSKRPGRMPAIQSAASSTIVPVSPNAPLTLPVYFSKTTGKDAVSCGSVELSIGSGKNGVKLARGTYFVAVQPAGSAAPSWASISAVSVNGKPVLRAAGKPVSFDYIVISTEQV